MLSAFVSHFRIQSLVYQLSDSPDRRPLALSSRDRWIRASESSIRLLFADDLSRRRHFLRFLRSGAHGIFLVRDGEWVSYGWCAPPRTAQPPHLPRWTRSLGAHWIFYCHTRQEFRGQGHYKRLLAQLVRAIEARDAHPLILCDTLPENFASRRAVLQSGFVPAGVVNAWRIAAPGLGGISVGGGWMRDQPHEPAITVVFPVEQERAAG